MREHECITANGTINMARKGSKTTQQPPDRIATLGAALPDQEALLFDRARDVTQQFHEAVLAGDLLAAEEAWTQRLAVVWRLNGGTLFGSHGDGSSAGSRIERHCAAAPGEVPQWGQKGEFLVEVDGLRAIVEFGLELGWNTWNFSYHVIDLDRPFVSETGFLSHFEHFGRGGRAPGAPVDEVARYHLRTQLRERGRKMVDRKSMDRIDDKWSMRPWVRTKSASAPSSEVFEDAGGQLAFSF